MDRKQIRVVPPSIVAPTETAGAVGKRYLSPAARQCVLIAELHLCKNNLFFLSSDFMAERSNSQDSGQFSERKNTDALLQGATRTTHSYQSRRSSRRQDGRVWTMGVLMRSPWAAHL